jgi:type I restriction enzyme S subunit
LGTISKINPRPPLIPLDEDEVAFVPMSSVSDDGTMEVKEYKSSSSLKGNYSYFQDGDLLVAKITPCFENKKISLASINRLHAFGSTEFHVIRVEREKLNARYLLHYLRQDIIRAKGESR